VHLVRFTIEIYYDARPYERQSIQLIVTTTCWVLMNITDVSATCFGANEPS